MNRLVAGSGKGKNDLMGKIKFNPVRFDSDDSLGEDGVDKIEEKGRDEEEIEFYHGAFDETHCPPDGMDRKETGASIRVILGGMIPPRC